VAPERRRIGLAVLNWNGREVLPLCLASLERAADASRHDVTLLLVDNASTDGSDAWAAAEHPRWEQLPTGANRRYAGGMNAALAHLLPAAPDYVALLNNDIEADPGLLDPLVADLEAEARRGAAAPRIHYHEARDRIWYGGGAVGRLSRVARHLGIRRRAAGRWLEAADTGYLTGCCILGRAEFWKTTGGFDEDFGFYAEDVDLSLRARALGWRLRYVPDALLYHRVGFSSGGGFSAAKLRAQRRATALLIRRHVRPALRPLAHLAWWGKAACSLASGLGRGERGLLSSLVRSLLPGKREEAQP
jgi:GT2 family glycosyltransferase